MTNFRHAAAVVLLRPAPTKSSDPWHVYLVKRSPHLQFFGGYYAFPGGSVDEFDHGVALESIHSEIPPTFYVAAVRELIEETGIWLLPHRSEPTLPERESMRRALLENVSTWSALREQLILQETARHLVPMGWWITPPFTPVRFEALYFGAWLPKDQEPTIWPGELVDDLWITPEDAIQRHERGQLFLSFPVLETLRVLLRHKGDLRATSQVMMAKGREVWPYAGGEFMTGVHMVPVRTPTLPPATHTNCYVLGRQELAIVDPATPYPEEQDRLIEYIEYIIRESGGRPREIWLTHHHPDHVGGVARIRAHFGLPVFAHAHTAALLQGRIAVDVLIEDNQVLTVRNDPGPLGRWRALFTPGHAPGHLCFYEENLHSIITGDLVVGIGTVLIAPPEGNMREYFVSLQRLLELDLGMLFPAHGPPIATAKEKIEAYIEHRKRREERILRALDAPLTPEQIVPIVYTDVDPQAYKLAELSVRAHLLKLCDDGMVEVVMSDQYVRCVQ